MAFLLKALLSPIHAIIHDLETPVEEVERVFGEVISDVKALIKELVALVEKAENLFNQAKFSELFITPFKDAVLLALNGIQTLQKLIFKYGEEGFDDVVDVLKEPIEGAYKLVKEGLAKLSDEYNVLVNKMEVLPGRVIDDSERFIHDAIERVDERIALVKQDIASVFAIVHAKGTEAKQDFVNFAKTAESHASYDINRMGTVLVDDVKALEQSVANRFKNENKAIDLVIVLIIGLVVMGLISLVFFTRSKTLLIALVATIMLVLVSFFVF